ncbi:MAG: hypothetical protein ACRD4L_14900 [Pyrinomonadaceae bacterium]
MSTEPNTFFNRAVADEAVAGEGIRRAPQCSLQYFLWAILSKSLSDYSRFGPELELLAERNVLPQV